MAQNRVEHSAWPAFRASGANIPATHTPVVCLDAGKLVAFHEAQSVHGIVDLNLILCWLLCSA